MGKEDLYREILDSLPNIIVITDGKSIYSGNYSFLDFVNCVSIKEFKENNSDISDLFIEYDNYIHKSDEKNWLEVVKKNRLHRSESMVMMYNSILDENRSYKVSYSKYGKEKKKAIVSFSDVTDMVRYRQLLKDTNEELENVIEKRTVELVHANIELLKNHRFLEQAESIANLGSWEFDPKSKKFTWSKEMYSICGIDKGYTKDLFKYFISIVADEDREKVENYFNKDNKKLTDFKIIVDGEVKYITSSSEISKDENGEEKIFGTYQNITEKVLILKDREEKERILIQQSKMAEMGEMIAVIAHQWRQPLNTLSLLVQDIPDAVEYEEMNLEYADKLSKQCMEQVNYMDDTITDFKNFFKPSTKKENFNVAEAFEDVLSLIGKQFQKHGIEVAKDYSVDKEFVVYGFGNEFKQVIINIVNNAKDVLLEREVEDGKVTTSIEKRDNLIKIYIKDNAGGVPEDILPKIFTPYFSTKGERGTGIGLQIAKTIIEGNMEGKIEAFNKNEGAVFDIELIAAKDIVSG